MDTENSPAGNAGTDRPSPVSSASVMQEIESFADESRVERFCAFLEEILFGSLKLQDIATRRWLHNGVLEFHFEQLGYIGCADDPADGNVVLLRIDGQLFAVRVVRHDVADGITPVMALPTRDGSAVLQVLSCDDFLHVWSRATGLAPEVYNTASSIQPYLRSLVSGSSVRQHGRELIVESVLGQGLEGTVFGVRDAATQEAFALKSTHKDVRDLYAHWKAGLERVQREAPRFLSHLCEFLSIEWHGDQGSTVLLQYRPLTSFREFVGHLTARERLREGLRVLADCIRLVQTLRRMDIYHGDIGVSNLFVYPEADGIEQIALIDPHPDGLGESQATVRKDLFGLAHMLYWLVTGTEWPEGTYRYMQRVIAGNHSREDAAEIFRAPPLGDDREHQILHEAAISALAGSVDTSDDICELILVMSDHMSHSAVATAGRIAPGATVTSASVEREFNSVLRPVGSGVFLPLFSLPSYFGERQESQREYGMGDTGASAREFIIRLKATGQKYWAILPVGPTDDRNCVYRADSVFAIGLNTIPPEGLLDDEWVTAEELDRLVPEVHTTSRVPLDDPRILSYKRSLLQLAWDRYVRERKWRERFVAFQRQEADWLYDYATYKSIENIYPGRWTTWPTELRDAEPAAIRTFAAEHAEDIEREAFFQFIAQHYFLKLRRFAESQGVVLVGDLPVYSPHGSADVWANRDVFELDENGERTIVAGAPPDIFDSEGQAWNHPMYRWDEEATITFHTRRFARMRRLFGRGFLRDDHIIGKITPWGFPFGTRPSQGARVTGACLGNALFDPLFSRVPGLQQCLIGEDLGIVTEETTLLLRHYGIIGMRVLQFIPFHAGQAAIDGDMYTPGNYPDRNLVLLGTHDTPTIRQWWRDAMDENGRRQAGEFIRRKTGWNVEVTDENVAQVLSEFATLQSAHMMIHQMPDLLVDQDGFTGIVDARMNDPAAGDANDGWKANWSWRMTPDAFDQETMDRLTAMTVAANRSPERTVRRLEPISEVAEEFLLAVALLRSHIEFGSELVERLHLLARQGRIRYASLGPNILSAVCAHIDGHVYLLLSNTPADDQSSFQEQAVSLIRGCDAALRHENQYYESPLEGCSDETLLQYAVTETEVLEQRLQQLAAFSSHAARERMVAFIGSLLSSHDEATTGEPRQNADSMTSGRSPVSDRFESKWTDIWRCCEQRGVARENIIDGLLNGTLPGAAASLRGLRWSLLAEFEEDCSRAVTACEHLTAVVAEWAAKPDLAGSELVLFGSSPAASPVEIDGVAPEGLSGTLHRLRQARRRELSSDHPDTRLPEYIRSLICTATAESPERRELLTQVDQFEHAGASQFELLLEILEQALIRRLAELSVGSVPVSEDDPAEIDTQIHSFYSDCGGQSVAAIVYTARQRGLKTIALTDHQTFDGVVEALETGRQFGVDVIPAIELYTGIRRGDGPVGDRRDVLVYFPDVQRFRRWYADGLDDETWQLFDDGWNRKIDGSQWGDVPIARVTSWARAHGGVPVLAHPGLLSSEEFHRDDWSWESFERLFLETGLAGIEISHSKLPFAENTVRYVPLVREFNRRHPKNPIVFTMGTDAHTSEKIGRANLTSEAVDYVARELIPDSASSESLQHTIVHSIRRAAGRIAAQSSLYRLRSDVLNRRFPGTKQQDRPLKVVSISDNAPSHSIVAGVKSHEGRPLIIVVNQGRREQFEGKDWGRLDLSDVLALRHDGTNNYEIRDPVSGQSYQHSEADLCANGLHIGLLPGATQFLSIEVHNGSGENEE